MAKKQVKKPANKIQAPVKVNVPKPVEPRQNSGFWFRQVVGARWAPYIPGVALFIIFFVITLFTYKDYGVSWDEGAQRTIGRLTYEYVFNGSQDLFNSKDAFYGTGYEFPLYTLEKWLNLTDPREVLLMRHFVTHLLFLVSALSLYVLAYRLFKNKLIASLGFLILVLEPRIYSHSFYNTKDLPFLCLFIITLSVCQYAFEKDRKWLYFLLGILCGYTTSIRIMGVMLLAFIGLFMLVDVFSNLKDKERSKKSGIGLALFGAGFFLTLYGVWPYLWSNPVGNFSKGLQSFTHYNLLNPYTLFNGKFLQATHLPWNYFPTWFLITNPELWLLAGLGGLVWLIFRFFKTPLLFLTNTLQRNILLYAMCFSAPVMAVILLHSSMYDDWRHLYFVFPSFVMLALYGIHQLQKTKYQMVVNGLCAVQVLVTGVTMVVNHPFNQVYFNTLVSHQDESLRKRFDLEYWGCSFKQGIDHLLDVNKEGPIRVYCDMRALVDNNLLITDENDRKRVQVVDRKNADYILTNFRNDPYDQPDYKKEYSISRFSSSIFCIFKQEKDSTRQRQLNDQEIAIMKKVIATHPDDDNAPLLLANAYFDNLQFDSGEIYEKRCYEINPRNVSVLKNLAVINMNRKDYAQAIGYFKQAVQILPDNSESYLNIGVCDYYLNQFDSAIYYWKKTIAVSPNMRKPYENLVVVYNSMGKPDSARKYEEIMKTK